MEKRILVLLMMLLLAGATMAQRKKKEAAKDSTAGKAVAVDTVKVPSGSVKAESDSLTAARNYDSLNAQLKLYKNFYAYISGKFFPEKLKNIEIEKAIALADSLSAANNSKWTGLQSLSKSKIDSLQLLLKTADTLRIQNQTFRALLESLIGENVFPLNETELKGSWQVYVQPLGITGTGLESGIVSLEKIVLPDTLYKSAIRQIIFLEEDLADIYFVGGKKTKCFYKVVGFSREKTFSILLQKADEINIRLFVTPVPRGLQVSYKLGKGAGRYMFGYMRK
jgi:hypothetical protein